ncbi:MAG: hypothetical protein QXZ44_01035 [Ferroplasma sp.]
MAKSYYLIFAGIAGFISAIFEAIMFYLFDMVANLPSGYQFTAIGQRVLGISGAYGQFYGLLLHFMVGTVVALVASIIAFYIKPLNIINKEKGLLIGILAGFLILMVFSLPVNILILHLYVYEKYELVSTDFYYSMHIFYGAVWGLFLGLFIKKYH